MTDTRIEAHRVTKPIQLLAAWLVGLIAIDTAFLAAAQLIATPPWIPAMLTIAAVCNVPVFLFCIFLLQTRFRPQMQEDEYYSQYLKDSMTQQVITPHSELLELRQEVSIITTSLREALATVQARVDDQLAVQPLDTPVQNASEVATRGAEVAALARSKKASRLARLAAATGSPIQINDLLPAYPALLTLLQSAKLRVAHTFGSTSTPPDVPALFVVTIGYGVDPIISQSVIRIASQVGLQGLQVSQVGNTEAIYMGSYGYKTRNFATASPGLLERVLVPGLSEEELLDQIAAASDQSPLM